MDPQQQQMMSLIQQQVAEAARAMMRPTTDAASRQAASQFLEHWTRTPQAWPVYVAWLRSFRSANLATTSSSSTAELVGMQLLCLQLLQAKIRREVPRGSSLSHHEGVPPAQESNVLSAILGELMLILQSDASQPAPSTTIAGPCCICLAALAIRCGTLPEWIQACCRSFVASGNQIENSRSNQNNNHLDELLQQQPSTALRFLLQVPVEMESCADLTTPQVTAELWPFTECVLDTLRRALQRPPASPGSSDLYVLASEALKQWVQTAHISLSLLNTPTMGGTEPLLPTVVLWLSSRAPTTPTERFVVQAAEALTEAVMVPTDHCTETRAAATRFLWDAVAQIHFVAAPMHHSTREGWDDAAVALSNLICTAVCEDIDDLISQPAEAILTFLLQLQQHSHVKVRLPVLECWLTVQEIPVHDRHDHWKAPLYRQVLQGLMQGMAYPSQFTSWDDNNTAENLLLDQTDFEDFRRMLQDVLISAYYLLRSEFVERMVQTVVMHPTHSEHWPGVEAALFVLVASATQVSGRIQSGTGGTSVIQDRERTAQLLLQLLHHVCGCHSNQQQQQHPLVLLGMTKFVAAYAIAWSQLLKSTPDAILQMLNFLRSVLISKGTAPGSLFVSFYFANSRGEAAKAMRSILVVCSSVVLQNVPRDNPQELLTFLHACLEDSLQTGQEECMTPVAEACTRLVLQIPRMESFQASPICQSLVQPVLHRGKMALEAATQRSETHHTDPAQVDEAVMALEALTKYLQVLHVMVRFCDAGSASGGNIGSGAPSSVPSSNPSTLITEIMADVWPFLDQVSESSIGSQDTVLDKVLAIHEQALKNVPDLVAPHFQKTMQYVVSVLQRSKRQTSSLAYISCAVETFGGSDDYTESFQSLLSHVAAVVFQQVQSSNVNEQSDLIQGFFELNQRYVLYCPSALVRCDQFQHIVACAVHCLTACQGERESTRATLNFLARLLGWRSLRVSADAQQHLQRASQLLDGIVTQYGAAVMAACMSTLLGGPQMLWPASTDCVFAILLTAISLSSKDGSANNDSYAVARQWIEGAMVPPELNPEHPNEGASYEKQQQVNQQVIGLLLHLASQGPKAKPKAKMLLTDYCKIHKGEMAPDALVGYALE